MSLKDADIANFQTILDAARVNRLALVESRCVKTGEYRALVCAMSDDGDNILCVPLAQMVTGNPFEDYLDPTLETLPEAVS